MNFLIRSDRKCVLQIHYADAAVADVVAIALSIWLSDSIKCLNFTFINFNCSTLTDIFRNFVFSLFPSRLSKMSHSSITYLSKTHSHNVISIDFFFVYNLIKCCSLCSFFTNLLREFCELFWLSPCALKKSWSICAKIWFFIWNFFTFDHYV